MMEPKAKWQRIECAGMWSVDVGPFHLDIGERDGHCSLWLTNPLRMIWQHKAATPCDVTDLMRLTEAELARRLVTTAETMEGGGLAAVATQYAPISNDDADDEPAIRSTPEHEMLFKCGDRVECRDTFTWTWRPGVVRSRYFIDERYRVVCDDGFDAIFRPSHLRFASPSEVES